MRVSLLDVTIFIVCDALSAAVRNELAMNSPELVGSSILMLPDFESDDEAVGCTSGTMIEMLADLVESMIGSPGECVCELNPNVVLVEPMLLESEKLSKETDTEFDDPVRERCAAFAVAAVLAIVVDRSRVPAVVVPDTMNPGKETTLEGEKWLMTEFDRELG